MTHSITTLEFQVLRAIDASEYGDSLGDAVWTFSIRKSSNMPAASLPGVCGSLSKKGFVECDDYEPSEATIRMTSAGCAAYVAKCAETGVEVRKPR